MSTKNVTVTVNGVQVAQAGFIKWVDPNSNYTVTVDTQTDYITVSDAPGAGALATDTLWDAAGDLAVGTGANTAAKLTVGTALTTRLVNTGSGTLAWTPHIVRKASDETVNNSGVLQNDDELFFSIAASETWAFMITLLTTSASVNADLLVGWTVPGGCTMQWGVEALATAGGAWGTNVNAAGTPRAYGSESTSITVGMGALSQATTARGVVVCGATPGTVQMQWAQNVATVEDTKVLKNSHLILWRLA